MLDRQYFRSRFVSHTQRSLFPLKISATSKVLFCPLLNKIEVCKNHIKSKLVRCGTKIQSIGDALFRKDGRTTTRSVTAICLANARKELLFP